jgi:hypothetical protein
MAARLAFTAPQPVEPPPFSATTNGPLEACT